MQMFYPDLEKKEAKTKPNKENGKKKKKITFRKKNEIAIFIS